MSNANRQPAGALELLDLNLQGEFPRELAESVSPVVEMSDFYLAGVGLRSISTNGSILAVGQALALTVPEGETWALRMLGFRAENAEVFTSTFSMGLRLILPGNITCPFQSALTQTILPAQFQEHGIYLEKQLIISAGTKLGLICNTYGGVPLAGLTTVFTAFFYLLTPS